MLIMLSFLAGIAATLAVIHLYPILRNSQLADLVVIAVRNRLRPAPAKPALVSTLEQTQAERERAMAAGLRTN
jgi:hypothetical protein